MCLEELRQEVDLINEELLKLLQQRAELAIEIGKYKSRHNQPVYNYEREEKILAKLQLKNNGPLQNPSVKNIFEIIIKECRNLQTTNLNDVEEE
jgi:chorismate mutase